jgi:hypothetical protein
MLLACLLLSTEGRRASTLLLKRLEMCPHLSRRHQEADAILKNKPEGSFVIRPSTTRPSEFVLAVKTG